MVSPYNRNFLWSSSPEYKRFPLIKWEEVCRSKYEGGLGLKNLQNRDLKNKSIWTFESKHDDCYYWKKMMLIRKDFAGMSITSAYRVKKGYK
ncbi:unnamed protein product [Cuscuta campestris]|uniref:Uncharacterized protein n=1 Tax=Cuscuta campestris TaxID=132261 RepID=A0A484NFW8_9ASTE|nr:unnamed protein product [Cuscuta campestris]